MGVIAIDAVGIGATGGGRSATLNLLRELFWLDRTNRYLLLVDQPEPELEGLGAQVSQRQVPIHHRLLCRGWAQLTWPVSLRAEGVELTHHIKNLVTLGMPGRSAVTIYDLAILLHPELYPSSDVLYWRHLQPRMLRRMDAIIAISQQTARDLARLYDLELDSIHVIYPAYDPRFRPLAPEEAARVRETYDTGERFILHVGSISRKKNLLSLLKAFERLCERGYEGKLVLVGRTYGKGQDAAFYEHLDRSPHRGRVRLTGPVPDDDLPAVYNAADMMVFPSLHEGFGLVAVEAMACGAPLITSNAGALPEVVGDGGVILEDASDWEEIAARAEGLLGDPAAREAQVARGLQRARRYSSEEAARRTLDLYRQLLAA